MSSATPSPAPARPREVSIAGTLTVAGSGTALVVMVAAMAQLNSAEMRQALQDLVDQFRDTPAAISFDTARSIVRYAIMASAVVSGTALILGIYVLRRHHAARIALTILGGFASVWALFAGPVGWFLAVYIGVATGLLWTRPARLWFAKDRVQPQPPAPPAHEWPPPSGWGPAPPPIWPPPAALPPPAPPCEEAPPPPPSEGSKDQA